MDDPILNLVSELKKLPGIGERTAIRIAFSILREEKKYAENLSKAISDLKDGIKLCSQCHNFTVNNPCSICSDLKRNVEKICVVSDPADISVFEKSRLFNGRYHVLHGVISPLDGIGPNEIRANELFERLKKNKNIKEVVIATDATVEGEATAFYLTKLLEPLKIKITRLATGVPMGAKLQYLDPATIALALDRRQTQR